MEKVKEIRMFEGELCKHFVGREQEVRAVILALSTKQHAVFIGPPGTAKSAIVLTTAKMLNVPFFYILLNKFTTIDELMGFIDPVKFKNGIFERNKSNKLLTAKIAFIDEIFKGSSEILNALLNIMNERIFTDLDGTVHKVPLHSLFSASNETPDEELLAVYDRFTIKHFVRPLDSTKLQEAIEYMLLLKQNSMQTTTIEIFEQFYNYVTDFLVNNASAIAKVAAQTIIVLRQHGIFISDRTAITHFPRLIATNTILYNYDLKKSALTTSKYLLSYEEDLENYRKALDSLIPTELREAQEKLERAFDLASLGDIKSAKREAAEANQILYALLTRKDVDVEEVRDLLKKAEELSKSILQIEKNLEELKKRR